MEDGTRLWAFIAQGEFMYAMEVFAKNVRARQQTFALTRPWAKAACCIRAGLKKIATNRERGTFGKKAFRFTRHLRRFGGSKCSVKKQHVYEVVAFPLHHRAISTYERRFPPSLPVPENYYANGLLLAGHGRLRQ